MKKERLKEIKDSIDFQLEVAKHIKADSVIECLNEEKELYNYVIELESMKEEIRKYINKWFADGQLVKYELLDILNKTNKE